MKTTGRLCKIDSLGRIVIPKQFRKHLGLHDGSVLELSSDDNCIIIKKHQESCVFCQSTSDLTEFEGRFICRTCLNKLKEKN